MKDLISREALQKEMLRVTLANPDFSHNYAVAVANEIDNAPAVDAVEVVHGRWEITDYGFYCTACGYNTPDYSRGNYCPNCGARMDGE